MTALDEAKYGDTIGEFIQLYNSRMSPKRGIKVGSQWVRMRPPDQDDFAMVEQDPRTLPFVSVGTNGVVTDVIGTDGLVTLRVSSGDSMMYGREHFHKTFVRLLDYSRPAGLV